MKRIFTFLMMVAAFAAAASCGLEGVERQTSPTRTRTLIRSQSPILVRVTAETPPPTLQ